MKTTLASVLTSTILALTFTAAPAQGADGALESMPLRPVVLDDGHIDLFELTYDQGSDQLDLNVKDDTGLYDLGVAYRDPETVTVAVDQELSGIQLDEYPPGYEFLAPAGRPLYLLDWSQQPDLPWPGWSTERLVATLPEGVEVPHEVGSIELAVDVAGPGDVFIFTLGGGPSGDQPQDRFIDTTDDQPEVIQTLPDSHYHTNWVFTEPGDYELTVTPSATTTTGDVLNGPAKSYHFHVGPRTGVPRKVPAADFGASITGVPETVGANTEVSLGLQLDQPHPEVAGYQWYRWIDGQGTVKIPGATTSQLSMTVNPWDWVSLALLDASGRVLSVARANFLPVPSAPSAPGNPSAWVEPNGTDVTLSWATPSNGNSPLTGYVVTLTSSTGQVLTQDIADGNAFEATFADVPAGSWTGTVHAINAIGAGPESEPSPAVTIAPAAEATSISAVGVRQVYGQAAKLVVSVSPNATGAVSVKAGAATVSGVLSGGMATVVLPAKALAPGARTVSISYPGVAGQFESSAGTASVTVLKAVARVRVLGPRRVRRGERAAFRVSVAGVGVRPSGMVRVRVAGRYRKVRLNDAGKATVRIRIPSRARPGLKRVGVNYLGDGFVTTGRTSTRIRVIR